MAFRLAEAFVELKMRGEKELHKSIDKTKEKVKEVGPAADQTEKKIETAAKDAAKEIDKSANAMVKSLQKPVDKLEELEREMKQKFSALNQRAANLGKPIAQADPYAMLGPQNAVFGRFAGAANLAAAGGLVGIASAVAQRGNEIATTGEDSKILGPEVSRDVRNVVDGIKEVGSTFKEVAGGFVDGLLGFIAILGNVVSFGTLRGFGERQAAEERRKATEDAAYRNAVQTKREIEAVDPYRPQRDMERRNRLDDIFKSGGIEGLEREASRIEGDMRTATAAKELLAVNERIAAEKDKAAKAGEQAAIAAEREAAAFRHAGQMATYGPGRSLEIAEEAWRTGRPAESIDAERRFNLGPQGVANMEARMRGLDRFKGANATAGQVEGFAGKAEERVAAMIEEGDSVKRLRREYEQLAAQVAALPAGAGKDAAQAKLAEAKMNVVAAEALDAEKRQNEAMNAAKREQLRDGANAEIAAIQKRFAELQLDAGNKPRDTAKFQTVGVQDFAKLIQQDVMAKEDEQKRIQEEKEEFRQAQELRQKQVDAVNAVKDELEKGLKAVAG